MPPCTFPIHSSTPKREQINTTYDYNINNNFISKMQIIIKNFVDEYIINKN